MTGRHRSTAQRRPFKVRRLHLITLVEAVTSTAHLITPDAMSAGRRGRFIAVCGADVVPHSMTAPPGAPCRACHIPNQRRSS